jgi:hypothetical protein
MQYGFQANLELHAECHVTILYCLKFTEGHKRKVISLLKNELSVTLCVTFAAAVTQLHWTEYLN